MILGDFNADGAYVSKREMQRIRIRSDKNFHWLIGDDVDTTASMGNTNTYDRWGAEVESQILYVQVSSVNLQVTQTKTESS